MPKKLEDIVIKGWCRANLALLSKSTIKEMSVLEFFKNLTTKSTQSGLYVEKSKSFGTQKFNKLIFLLLLFNLLKRDYFIL